MHRLPHDSLGWCILVRYGGHPPVLRDKLTTIVRPWASPHDFPIPGIRFAYLTYDVT